MLLKNSQKDLFEKELAILEDAHGNLLNTIYKDNELLSKYSDLISAFYKLLKLTSKAFKISDIQGRDLKRRENDIKNLLDNSNQGFLTFGKDMLVDREYSSECLRIFNKKIAHINIVELISGQNDEQNKLFENIFKNTFEVEDIALKLSYIKQLPTIIKINENYINIKYKLIDRLEYETENDIIMLILTDITDKRKAEDQVLYMSYHDKLTSLYNRAYIDSIIPELQSSPNLPFSVVMADMNGLKLTNDVFGHQSGDKLLCGLAGIFLSCCRKSDIVARWGGDEFLILLPGADSIVCEKICRRITAMCKEVIPEPIELSVSLGMATTESTSMKISDLFSIAENMMYSNKLVESKKVRRDIILRMEKVLHEKCFESYDHNERVKMASINIAKLMGMKQESIEIINLTMLASLHDIGKIAIPREILCKSSPLTNNEWKIVQSHSEIGYRMAQSIEEPILAQAILAMRERWDGSGYPYSLKAEKIPLISRIVAIVDAYDAMTHERPYRDKKGRDEALLELKRCSGSQFDPDIVKLFLDNIEGIIS